MNISSQDNFKAGLKNTEYDFEPFKAMLLGLS